MLVYAPGWSLASQFWSYTPPPKKVSFPWPKNENSPLKLLFLVHCFFYFFGVFCIVSAKNLSRRSRLSRWSRAPSRLIIRPRSIDCDRGHEKMVKTLPVFRQFLFEHRQKKGGVCARYLLSSDDLWLSARSGSREYIGHKVQSGNPLV